MRPFVPHAGLYIFKDDHTADIAHIAHVLNLPRPIDAAARASSDTRAWKLSTQAFVRSRLLRAHADWITYDFERERD
jgi:hypothetical protein